MGYVVQVVMTAALGWVCFMLGQKYAWDYIAQNYIAIHKSAVIGRVIFNTNEEKKNVKRPKKNQSRSNDKKTSK